MREIRGRYLWKREQELISVREMQIECPHPDCGRKFDKLIMLIDQTRIPRETYYVCPHCGAKKNTLMSTLRPEKRLYVYYYDNDNNLHPLFCCNHVFFHKRPSPRHYQLQAAYRCFTPLIFREVKIQVLLLLHA